MAHKELIARTGMVIQHQTNTNITDDSSILNHVGGFIKGNLDNCLGMELGLDKATISVAL